MEQEVPPELAQYLGVTTRLGLFRSNPDNAREVFRCAPTKETVGFQPIVDFHDAYPLHLLSLSSIQDLEGMVVKDEHLQNLDARRFRANMIVTGTAAYAEDSWKSIVCKSGAANSHFQVSCRTARCKLPNVDPSNGIRHKSEPDHSLRKYREVDPGAPKNGCLGVQLCPVFPGAQEVTELESYIEVGMQIEVVEEGEHFYIPQ